MSGASLHANFAFDDAVLEVLNREDAFACVPDETLRRIRAALVDANVGLIDEAHVACEQSDQEAEAEWEAIQAQAREERYL